MRSTTTLTTLVALGTSTLLLAGCAVASGAETNSTTSTSAPSTPQATAERQATTAAVVEAAQAFLATLSPEQRAAVVLDIDDPTKRTGWNNLPLVVAPRAGVVLVDLDQTQQDALEPVLQSALSPDGYAQVQGIRAADDYLASEPEGVRGPPESDPPVQFGSDQYTVAFFGEPSTTSPFQLMFTGHHLAHNITFTPEAISHTPEFIAVEPDSFAFDGAAYRPLEEKIDATRAMIAGLDSDQVDAAQIPGTFDDVMLNSGQDDEFPEEPEGLTVSDLSQEDQDAVSEMLRSWVGDADPATEEELMKAYIAEYDETRIGLAGTTSLEQANDYVRIDGPRVWVEVQAAEPVSVEPNVHYHSVYRDEALDYGGL
ncbi:MAG: hypothetical protein RI885_1456 [Actinomycetota bacterium]|jgi:hypothetical protein